MNSRSVYLVMSAYMPNGNGSRYGHHGRVAIVECDASAPPPKRISKRSRGLKRIVSIEEPLNIGKTDRCAFRRAIVAATAECARLNGDSSSPQIAGADA